MTWYKKIDSTLRGNLGAELEAMLDALPQRAAVICPAFPAQQRGLLAGRLVYSGARPRHLPSLLAEQSTLAVAAITLETVRGGAEMLAQTLDALRQEGKKLIVVDALEDADLITIVAASQMGGYLLCGSAGLVGPLSAAWGREPAYTRQAARVQPGPVLAVVGSGSAVAQAQIAAVAAAETMAVHMVGENWDQAEMTGAQCHSLGDRLLHLAPPDSPEALEGPVARAHAAALADVAFTMVEELQPSVLLVVGGDTAYYVLRRLGIHRLTVVEELLPGIPLTFGTDRTGQSRAVVLKPGSFGDAQTLLALQSAVAGRQGALSREQR